MIKQCTKLTIDYFPFKASLSLSPLIDYWKEKIDNTNPLLANLKEDLLSKLSQAPELLQKIRNENILQMHQALIEMLMSALFPWASRDKEMVGAFTPFEKDCFYATPLFRSSLLKGTSQIHYPPEIDESQILYHRIFYVYILILKKFYNREVNEPNTLPFVLKDEQTNLNRYYKIYLNTDFVKVNKVNELPFLSSEELKRLLHNFHDLDLWMEFIPPRHFELEGFVLLNLVDVTEGETLSALKYSLLDNGSLTSPQKFNLLQIHLRTLLQRADLLLGISAMQKSGNTYWKSGCKISRSFTSPPTKGMTCAIQVAKFYEELVTNGVPLFIENIEVSTLPVIIIEALKEQNVGSIVCIPLYLEDNIIGVLELAFPQPTDLSNMVFSRIEEVLPLFALALQWNKDQEENKIDAIIKEKFTAIHPSVEWRFKEAAINLLDKQYKEEALEIEPIVFPQIYPLYAAADIRNSSIERNHAIRQDLLSQLRLANDVINKVFQQYPLPIYAKLIHKTHKYIKGMESGLLSDAEISTNDFFKREIEPVFRHIASVNQELKNDLQIYWSALDDELGMLYNKRKDFEESLMQINDALSRYIEDEEQQAQQMFPHYFEKYKTDGIEYTIYVGASLVQNQEYSSIYLKNLRLWQLMTLCEMTRRAKALQPQLKIPLETTGLILVHSLPLSIRFRLDERHFDVDGAYNIRYEILKKRIDKALVKDTNERLTQPGKIVIIYSQFKEASEYYEYIDYLRENGILKESVENLEVEDLQGVQGLKALRVEVKLNDSETLRKKSKPAAVIAKV